MGSAWQQCRMPNADCVLLRWAAAGSDMNAWCDLKLRTKEFALAVIRLVQSLVNRPETRVIGQQLLRAGTAVGANYRSACRARSKADFISKIGIVIEEADECCFWLELLLDSKLVASEQVLPLLKEANE